MPALTDSRTRALLARPPKAKFVGSEDTHIHDEEEGILLLSTKRKRQKDEQPYRSITSFKNDAELLYSSSSTSESEGGDSSDADDDILTLPSQQETLKLLEQQLSAEPWSVDKWLLLLSHTLSSIPVMSKNASKARSEITISILARALGADSRNSTSVVLRLKYMKAGEQVWHESKIRAEWEHALKTGGVELWMEWLEWRIRRAGKGVDGMIEDATRVMGASGHDAQGEITRIRVFWRVAVALQGAGSFATMFRPNV
jgi:hypothetical protein